jgi:hypothetical protein
VLLPKAKLSFLPFLVICDLACVKDRSHPPRNIVPVTTDFLSVLCIPDFSLPGTPRLLRNRMKTALELTLCKEQTVKRL